jgi:DNA invertase Pin-like site-specific DNA recombinase
MSRRAVAYLRTSSHVQVDREGPRVQEDDCRQYAAVMGLEVVAVLHDKGITGTTAERPAWAEAVAMIEDGEADAIVVQTASRVGREVMIRETLLDFAWDAGAEIHETDEGLLDRNNPDAKLVRIIKGAIAEYVKVKDHRRMLAARKRIRDVGGKAEGQYPLGFTKTGIVAGEFATLMRARELIEDRGMSFASASAVLNAEGHRTRHGREWSRQNLGAVYPTAIRYWRRTTALAG